MRTTLPSTSLLAALLVLSAAPVASANEASDAILRECAVTGEIAAGHAPADLQRALAELPLDALEYTDCERQLTLALHAATSTLTERESVDTLAASSSAARAFGMALGGDDPADPSADAEADSPAAQAPSEAAAEADEAQGTDPVDGPAPAPGPEDQVSPLAQPVGGLAAAGVVGASLLTLLRPGMLRRRGPDEE